MDKKILLIIHNILLKLGFKPILRYIQAPLKWKETNVVSENVGATFTVAQWNKNAPSPHFESLSDPLPRGGEGVSFWLVFL